MHEETSQAIARIVAAEQALTVVPEEILDAVVMHQGSVIPLKYFFTAYYNDGTFFNQHVDDISVLLPEEERVGKSSFSDVDHSRLIAFGLVGEKDNVIVDLKTGAFHVNGHQFYFHDEDTEQLIGQKSLIFQRQHDHEINQVTLDEVDHRVVYKIGWQATCNDGTLVRRLMRFK